MAASLFSTKIPLVVGAGLSVAATVLLILGHREAVNKRGISSNRRKPSGVARLRHVLSSRYFLLGVFNLISAIGSAIAAVAGIEALGAGLLVFSFGVEMVMVALLFSFAISQKDSVDPEPIVKFVEVPSDRKLDGKPLGNSERLVAYRGGIGPEYEMAERALTIRGRLETFTLRVKSTAMRDVFARAATAMQYDATDVQRVLRTMRAGKLPGNDVAAHWRSDQLLTLARILANQAIRESDIDDSEVLFNAVLKIHGPKKFGRSDLYIFPEVLAAQGRHREALQFARQNRLARRDPVHFELMKANEASMLDDKMVTWTGIVNGIFLKNGLIPISLDANKPGPALDRIRPGADYSRVDGPLVTVIVPTFNGSEHITTALDSLRNQTWQNLEVIVVDDGSSADHQTKLTNICKHYENVRLILNEVNRGAYPARNDALAIANGDFITVHDDDDWSHPQKIEFQMNRLLEDPHCPGNMSRHVRATEEIYFKRINNNPSFCQANYSSLLVRRDMLQSLGGWDQVNRGGDAEFRDRLREQSGRAVEVVGDVPLSFTRTHETSLTAGEIGRGYVDPARLFYQRAYTEYHKSISASGGALGWANPRIDATPINMLPGKRGKNLGRIDVVFGTDFSFPGGTSSLTLNEIATASNAGLTTGMLHMFSPVNTGKEVTQRSLELAGRPDVSVVSLQDEIEIGRLVIRHPSVLQFAENLTSNFKVKDLIVVVNNPPVLAGGRGYVFDLNEVSANAESLFGIKPRILAESGVTQALSRPLVPSSILADETWPGFVDSSLVLDAPRHPGTGKPTLGRHSRDSKLKWPSKMSTIRKVYFSNDGYDVRIMGGVDSLGGTAKKEIAEHSDVLGFNAQPVSDFLDSLDFWVYYHADSLTESFGMAAVEAMARGLVVILPEYMRPNFGDGALYAEPGEVRGIVRQYWEKPCAYTEQSEKAICLVKEKFSERAFLDRLT
ncbi:glycosyltransferase [Corynebacterium afermentans]